MQGISLQFISTLPYFPAFQTSTDRLSMAVAHQRATLSVRQQSTCKNKFTALAQLHLLLFSERCTQQQTQSTRTIKTTLVRHIKRNISLKH